MAKNYIKNYIQAIENPLPELKAAFDAEINFFKKNAKKNFIVLDAGCGAGRPANLFAKLVKKLVCIDCDQKMIDLAKRSCAGLNNIKFLKKDALNTGFSDEFFDLSFATYNLIGEIKKTKRQKLVNEMVRVTKKRGRIILVTWKDNIKTTEFLKKYYPSIGIKIIKISNSKTLTSKGIFERISKKELYGYCKSANLKKIKFCDINPVWIAVIGSK